MGCEMNVADDAKCFVCGAENETGLQAEFEVDIERQRSLCHLSIPERFQGWQNVVHGGILATLLDEACIYACRSVTPNCVTADLAVRYKKPVAVGDALTISAEVTAQKRKIFMVSAKIVVNDVVHAEAEARVFQVS